MPSAVGIAVGVTVGAVSFAVGFVRGATHVLDYVTADEESIIYRRWLHGAKVRSDDY